MIQLQTEHLTVRRLGPGDASIVLEYQLANAEYTRPWAPTREPDYFTLDFHRRLLEECLVPGSNTWRFFIFHNSDHTRVIGDISFSQIVGGPFNSCYAGYSMLGSEAGKGYMTEALRVCIEYMFSEMGLHRIQANVMPINPGSVRILEKLGFKREGKHDKYLKINGEWRDHYSYALLNSDPSI